LECAVMDGVSMRRYVGLFASFLVNLYYQVAISNAGPYKTTHSLYCDKLSHLNLLMLFTFDSKITTTVLATIRLTRWTAKLNPLIATLKRQSSRPSYTVISTLYFDWLGHLTRKIVSEMTYNVSSGTLNTTILYYT